ncbi:alpha/beta hydrolase [Patescibacteria group bacterium]|nr:alpha/beta hydrolase [Patescibacteria group bacterium]
MEHEKLLHYIYHYDKSEHGSNTTLLLLHGTGGDERDLLRLGRMLDPDAHILSPRGNVLEGGYNRFFERLSAGVFNEEDIITRSKDLAEFVAAAQAKYGIQHTKVIAVGFSNGANIAASLLLLHPIVLSGAILFRAMVPLIPKEQPDLSGVPILLLSGTEDTIIQQSKVYELKELFTTGKSQLTHEWLETGHEITSRDVEIATTWLTHNFK